MKAPLGGLGEPPRQAGQELSYRCDPESSAQLIQIPADTAPHASEPDSSRSNGEERSEVSKSPRKKSSGRKDRGRRHVVRGSVLSRSLIQTLERLGENVRALKRMESELRATLKPLGALGRLIFDRFWASILRLILVSRLEENGLAPQGITAKNSASVPSLREGALPILVLPGDGDGSREDPERTIVFDSDVFRRLALDCALRPLRGPGDVPHDESPADHAEGRETGLENLLRVSSGIKNEIGEDNQNG